MIQIINYSYDYNYKSLLKGDEILEIYFSTPNDYFHLCKLLDYIFKNIPHYKQKWFRDNKIKLIKIKK